VLGHIPEVRNLMVNFPGHGKENTKKAQVGPRVFIEASFCGKSRPLSKAGFWLTFGPWSGNRWAIGLSLYNDSKIQSKVKFAWALTI
jgi:hypothetical protein